jgi:hypothetical protein
MTQVQTWISNAAAWISQNSTDVLYIGLAVAAVALIGGGKRR